MRMPVLQQLQYDYLQRATRRHFMRNCATGLGATWLALRESQADFADAGIRGADSKVPSSHACPRAKRVIFLHMAGAPSQLELFDYKPELEKLDGEPCPESFLKGKRFAFIQGVPNMLGPQYPFEQVGGKRTMGL